MAGNMMGHDVSLIGWSKMDVSATSGGGYKISTKIRRRKVRAAEKAAWRAELDELMGVG